MSNATFRHVIEKLLQGELLCEVSDEPGYLYLQLEDNLDRVNQHLAVLGRGVALTSDMTGYYCVYLDVEDKGVRNRLNHQFHALATKWEALLMWLRLTRQLSPEAHPLSARDILKESELLGAIESSSALQAELESIAQRFQIRGKVDPRTRLNQLLRFLEKEGFLVERHPSVYQATARWSMLQDQMEFIRQQEGIQLADREYDQASAQEQEQLI